MTELVNQTPRTYVLAASESSYYKTVITSKAKIAHWTSNPDIALVRTHEAVDHIEAKDWGGVSDHHPVMFTIKAILKLKYMRTRVAKSLFLAPAAIKEAKIHYEDGADNIMEKIEKCKVGGNDADIKKLYKEVEQFKTSPWERVVQRSPPLKPL